MYLGDAKSPVCTLQMMDNGSKVSSRFSVHFIFITCVMAWDNASIIIMTNLVVHILQMARSKASAWGATAGWVRQPCPAPDHRNGHLHSKQGQPNFNVNVELPTQAIIAQAIMTYRLHASHYTVV